MASPTSNTSLRQTYKDFYAAIDRLVDQDPRMQMFNRLFDQAIQKIVHDIDASATRADVRMD